MLYLIVIPLTAAALTAGHLLAAASFSASLLGTTVLRVLAAIAAVIAIDGVFAFLLRRLPKRWFSPLAAPFAVSPKEQKFLRACGVPRWKDLVPELGCFTAFRKNRLASPFDPDYLARFLLESNYGVVIHLVDAAAGFLLFALPFVGMPSIALPVALVNLVLSLMPAMILRYHTPALRRLYRRALRKRQERFSRLPFSEPLEKGEEIPLPRDLQKNGWLKTDE